MKEQINYLADLLETIGVPSHKRVGKIFNDLDGVYSERHIRRLLGVAELDEKTDIVSENITSVPNEIEIANADIIALTDRLISYFKDNFRKKLATVNIQGTVSKEILAEDMYVLNNLLDTGEEALDERQTVLEVDQYKLFRLIAKQGPSFAADSFLEVKPRKLTPKQTTNYRLGQVRHLHPLFSPHDEEEAVSSPAKFYGVPCKFMWCLDCEHGNKITAAICVWCNSTNLQQQGCGSWNIKTGNQNDAHYVVHCFSCQADFIPTTKPLPRTTTDVTINYQVPAGMTVLQD